MKVYFLQWMSDEAKSKGKPFDRDEWSIEQIQGPNVPQQTDGFNCGMFVTLVADSIVHGSPLNETSYSQDEMPNYRMRLAKAILLGKLYNASVNINV